jgi:hypothetical protein
MKTRDPYQIIIMRPTGERAVMTIRSFWVKVFITGLVTLAVVLVVLAVWLADTRKNLGESRHATEIQSGELRDLNLLLTRKDEEIISLKKKLSMSTIYQSLPDTEEPAATPAVSNVPMDHPPFAGIKELFMTGSSLSFRIENVRPSGQGAARGHLFIVFRKQDSEICYPAADIVNGIPAETKKGLPFAIRYFKPMNVPVPPAMSDWESITFHIFDEQGKMRLSMPLDRKQIQ